MLLCPCCGVLLLRFVDVTVSMLWCVTVAVC